MKISVQFEADSAAEYDRIIEALSGPGRAMFVTRETLPKPDQPVVTVKTEEIPVPVRDEPVIEVGPAILESPVVEPAVVDQVVQPVKAKRGRKPKTAPETEVISSQPPVEEPEIEVAVPAPNGFTRVDLSDAFKAYVHLYGTNAGFADVSKLLQKTFGDTVRKASDVADENIAKAIAVVRQAIDDNPFNRERTYAQ